MFLKNLFRYWTFQVFSPGTVLREKYDAFKTLLAHDKAAHEIMAELEAIYYNQERVDFQQIADKYDLFAKNVAGIVDNLIRMCPGRYLDLKTYFKKFDGYVRFMLTPPENDMSPPFTVLLGEPSTQVGGKGDGLSQGLVGGKAANLSKIAQDLKLPVPAGFAITTRAFHALIDFNRLRTNIDAQLANIDINDTPSLDRISANIMDWILRADIPPAIEAAVSQAWDTCKWESVDASVDVPEDKPRVGDAPRVAVRSSAVAEDGVSSFAGQYHSELNVSRSGLLDAYKKVIASKYSSRALYYRINYGLSDLEAPMAVLVLEMVDAVASGVMYSHSPQTLAASESSAGEMDIHAIWGLGELLVGGEVSPDVIRLSRTDPPKIVNRQIGPKAHQMFYSSQNKTEVLPVSDDQKQTLALDDAGALALAQWGLALETFFGEPQDVEWCQDNRRRLVILQSRPLKTDETAPLPDECYFDEIEKTSLLSGGEKAAAGIGAGPVVVVKKDADLQHLAFGSVLVAKNARPHYVKVLNKVNAVVTDTGSAAGHFASVAREFGIPVLVNTGVATLQLDPGREVTVYADEKTVYNGVIHPMLESPCARKDLLIDSPFMRKMRYVMGFISTLKLVDPNHPDFTAHGCRSLHDIIRFCHEKAVSEMFSMGDRRITRKQGARKLISTIPMQVYILDVGHGVAEKTADAKTIRIEEVKSPPMRAVWKGLNHPGIQWSDFGHFDWAEYDKIVMNGGIISADSALFSSYAVLSDRYMNLALKFGYHFVIIDAICADRPDDNYASFRFTGGGSDFTGRSLRARFLRKILDHIGFDIEDKKGDLVNARLHGDNQLIMERKLELLGRLLGASCLMDMYLKDESQIEGFVSDFLAGRYHFATVS